MPESTTTSLEKCVLPHAHSNYECGLIDAADMPRHQVMIRDEQFTDYFASLCELSDKGWVAYHDRIVKLDCYMENGNQIFSYIDPQFRNDGSVALDCSNLIRHRNGNWYFEVHATVIGVDGTLHEPAVGSVDVLPHDFVHPEASMVHYRVAYEASPLLTAA